MTGFGQRRLRRMDGGFTLLEALVALALMGLIVGAIAAIAGQWLPAWNRPARSAQRSEQIAIAIDRIASDLAAAQWTTIGNGFPFFRGTETEVIFIRSVLGPNGGPGLEFVRLVEIAREDGPVLTRESAPFLLSRDDTIQRISFGNPVILLRAPLRALFAYSGPDGRWSDRFVDLGVLPSLIRFIIRDEQGGDEVTAATRVLVNSPAPRPESMIFEEARAGATP